MFILFHFHIFILPTRLSSLGFHMRYQEELFYGELEFQIILYMNLLEFICFFIGF
jgi:hypothetical protein